MFCSHIFSVSSHQTHNGGYNAVPMSLRCHDVAATSVEIPFLRFCVLTGVRLLYLYVIIYGSSANYGQIFTLCVCLNAFSSAFVEVIKSAMPGDLWCLTFFSVPGIIHIRDIIRKYSELFIVDEHVFYVFHYKPHLKIWNINKQFVAITT